MKRKNRFLALALAMVLALSLLPGCGGSEEEPEATTKNEAQLGGSITWPEEGLDTSATLASTIVGDTLYMVFNGVQARTSGYFTPAGDTITITSSATTTSETRFAYRVTLWKETYGGREYVDGGIMYFTADGECRTGTFTGLEAGTRYKIGLAYDGGSHYMSGGVTIAGLAQADALDDEDTSAA
ncbi:hypothetical protein [Candidatus Allofournierella excrementavium]|uniref:hypothetical protein n=1 Tax=Candidatus Allofournierella excrementavium TaxID=2838591 RepID=UPI003AF5A614